MLINRNLAKNKQKITCLFKDALVNAQQNGFTTQINNGIGPCYQLKSICQATLRALAKPR